MAVAARVLPYARANGLASAFLGGSPVLVGASGGRVAVNWFLGAPDPRFTPDQTTRGTADQDIRAASEELADEAQQRGLVNSISASHVNRILREVDLKPHKSQYWCNTTEKDPDLFQQQVELVCQTDLGAALQLA